MQSQSKSLKQNSYFPIPNVDNIVMLKTDRGDVFSVGRERYTRYSELTRTQGRWPAYERYK